MKNILFLIVFIISIMGVSIQSLQAQGALCLGATFPDTDEQCESYCKAYFTNPQPLRVPNSDECVFSPGVKGTLCTC